MRSALDTAPGIFASTEVGRAALEEGLVLVARDVDAYIGAPALRVAHLAEHPAVGEKMPSMASREPLGLASMSMEAAPEASTYWVAIWPFAISRSSSAWGL